MVFITRLILLPAGRRVPTIKFRKGGLLLVGDETQSAAASGAAAPVASNAIEDWQLPSKYWRKPLDQAEMDYINRGGPA